MSCRRAHTACLRENLIRQINLDHPGAKNSFFMQYYMEISPDGRQTSLRKRRIQFVYERKAYYENVNVKNEVKLRKLLEQLPDFCKQFFIGIEPTTSSRTRIAYAYDIGCFLTISAM